MEIGSFASNFQKHYWNILGILASSAFGFHLLPYLLDLSFDHSKERGGGGGGGEEAILTKLGIHLAFLAFPGVPWEAWSMSRSGLDDSLQLSYYQSKFIVRSAKKPASYHMTSI